jgi:long-chain acyl-CoA synthetase
MHRNLVASALQTWYENPNRDQEKAEPALCVTPFFHVYGLTVGMNRSIYGGSTMVLLARFDPAEVREAFERAAGGLVVEGYGLTEAAPVTHGNPLGRTKKGTIGVPCPDTDAAIVDDEANRLLPPGCMGELVLRGPQVMAGYWNRPDETALVLKDGWLCTGDSAITDEEGYVRIIERVKDMIIASVVQEVAVCGAPDSYRSEMVKGVVVLKPGATATAEEIIASCRARLASFKAPHIVAFRDALPKSSAGKVLRREVKASP